MWCTGAALHSSVRTGVRWRGAPLRSARRTGGRCRGAPLRSTRDTFVRHGVSLRNALRACRRDGAALHSPVLTGDRLASTLLLEAGVPVTGIGAVAGPGVGLLRLRPLRRLRLVLGHVHHSGVRA
ncbi:putative membrane protein [Saccharothrix espanaensis DSM 44229]|uniref:Putative membrane protein n=1 Tax=Saccharothrix espanaensis (strain ATCC 51144 / DSM 44229 / JCM 9112 / NBRC 15066 / NRRL 15764) TaxID=1179773 RepID=K0JUV5_SACES|nr:putative membrane protein [Saccharothrix espanaensis DSM 44229]